MRYNMIHWDSFLHPQTCIIYTQSTSKSHDHETYHIMKNMRGVRGDVGKVWACSCCELLATGGPIIFAQIGVCVSQTGCTAAQHDTLNHWFGKQRDNLATSSKRSESVEKVNTLLHPRTNKHIYHDSWATVVIIVYMSRLKKSVNGSHDSKDHLYFNEEAILIQTTIFSYQTLTTALCHHENKVFL